MTILKWLYSKKVVALAAAGAVALGVGMVATPNEAAAQCTIQDTTGTTTDIDTASDLDNPTGLGSVDGTDTITVNCDNSIDTGQLVDDAVTQDKIADDAVGAGQLANDAVDTDAIQDGAVNSAKVEDNSLTADDLAANSVTASELADNSVDTAAIQDNAVTWDKLSSGVRDRINENEEGVAIALALQNPDLVGKETFGLAVNWGGFEDSNALGIAATGVLGHDIFGAGDRLAIAGGVGVGFDEDTVGGRVGAQLSW
jgi:hypothetical protein